MNTEKLNFNNISNFFLIFLNRSYINYIIFLFFFLFINLATTISFASTLKEARDHLKNNDFISANKIFFELSEKGNAEAQHELAISFINGEGIKKNIKQGYQLLLLSANSGFILSQIKICDALVNGQKRAVENPLKKNYSKALKYCIPSANRGSILSQANLFEIYSSKDKNQQYQNLKKAYFWAKKAAYNKTDSIEFQHTHNVMIYELALIYEKGLGASKDYSKAYELYNKAANNGLAVAQFALGNVYELGMGNININLKKAYNYFKMAAKQKYIPSFVNLGLMYKNGKYVKKDKMKANMWMFLASINGDNYGDKNLSRWKENNILQLLQEDIPKLKKMIKQCAYSKYLNCYYK